MRNYVIINGVNSLTIQGLAINNLPPITKPMIRTQIEEIDGRDGDIVTELGYSAYDKSMEIGLYGNFDIDAIIKYFTGEGIITFSNEPDKFYYFKILNQIDYEKLLKFKTAVVTFHCQPFKYPVEETPIEGEAITITGSGSNITLENTVVAPMEMKVKGNTSQNGTPTPSSPIPVQVVSGDNSIEVSNNINNKGIRLGLYQIANGEYSPPTSGNRYATFNDLLEVQPNTTYKVTTTNNINAQFYQLQYDESKTYLSNSSSAQSVKDYTFTTSATTKYLAIDIRAYDMTNITTDYVGGIEVIDTKASYPISLGVENLLSLRNGVYSSNGITATVTDDEVILNGTASGTSFVSIPTNSTYNLSLGEQYTISINNSATNTGGSLRIDSNGAYDTSFATTNKTNTITINSSSTPYTNTITIRTSSGTSYSNYKIKPQIEKGSIAHSYNPYGKAIELCKIGTYQDKIDKSSGKNLLNSLYTHSAGESVTANGITFTYNSNGSVTLNGTATALASATYFGKGFSSTEIMIPLDKTSYYTLSNINPVSGVSIFVRTVNGTTLTSHLTASKYVNFNNEEGITEFYIQITSGTTLNNVTVFPMLEKGSTTTPEYEPYGTSWYLKKEIGKVVLDGTENWGTVGSVPNGFYTDSNKLTNAYNPVSGSTNIYTYCDKFVSTYRSAVANYDYSIAQVNNGSSTGHGNIIIRNKDITGNINTWLTTNNTTLYYVLATPTYEYITDTTLISQLEALKPYSYNPVTNIAQTNNDAPFELDVSLSYTNTMNVNNVGNIYAKPILTIEGSGTIGIILNDIEVLSVDLGTDEKITIDVPNLQAYNPDNDVLLNRNVTGDYMKLLINDGDNTIAFSGSVTSATLTNYTRWI